MGVWGFVPRKFYDDGWNDYLLGVPFDIHENDDWKDGWLDCKEAYMNGESPQPMQ